MPGQTHKFTSQGGGVNRNTKPSRAKPSKCTCSRRQLTDFFIFFLAALPQVEPNEVKKRQTCLFSNGIATAEATLLRGLAKCTNKRGHVTSLSGVVNISYLSRSFRRHFKTNLCRECGVIESRMFTVDGFTCLDLKALIIDPAN